MQGYKKAEYLGVRIDLGIKKDSLSKIFNQLLNKGASKIYTVNPEFIVDSYFDLDFKKELNSSDLNVIDGIGLLYGLRIFFKQKIDDSVFKNLELIPGVDLTDSLLDYADQNNLSVFILGGNPKFDSSSKALEKIKVKYPNLKLVGSSSSFSYKSEDDSKTVSYIKSCLAEKGCDNLDILLVGYGHKNQEFWISRNSHKIPAKISIGVGGTIDYFSGMVPRAPKFFRKLGLEWLFRLFIQPSRFLRIIKATVIFPILSLKN